MIASAKRPIILAGIGVKGAVAQVNEFNTAAWMKQELVAIVANGSA